MRTIIAGSRSIADYKLVEHVLDNLAPFEITTVLSGHARGVDTYGEEWAKSKNIPLERYPANWSRDGRSAGVRRNLIMASSADALVAIWDGESKGTKHMIDTAKQKELLVYVYKLGEQNEEITTDTCSGDDAGMA